MSVITDGANITPIGQPTYAYVENSDIEQKTITGLEFISEKLIFQKLIEKIEGKPITKYEKWFIYQNIYKRNNDIKEDLSRIAKLNYENYQNNNNNNIFNISGENHNIYICQEDGKPIILIKIGENYYSISTKPIKTYSESFEELYETASQLGIELSFDKLDFQDKLIIVLGDCYKKRMSINEIEQILDILIKFGQIDEATKNNIINSIKNEKETIIGNCLIQGKYLNSRDEITYVDLETGEYCINGAAFKPDKITKQNIIISIAKYLEHELNTNTITTADAKEILAKLKDNQKIDNPMYDAISNKLNIDPLVDFDGPDKNGFYPYSLNKQIWITGNTLHIKNTKTNIEEIFDITDKTILKSLVKDGIISVKTLYSIVLNDRSLSCADITNLLRDMHLKPIAFRYLEGYSTTTDYDINGDYYTFKEIIEQIVIYTDKENKYFIAKIGDYVVSTLNTPEIQIENCNIEIGPVPINNNDLKELIEKLNKLDELYGVFSEDALDYLVKKVCSKLSYNNGTIGTEDDKSDKRGDPNYWENWTQIVTSNEKQYNVYFICIEDFNTFIAIDMQNGTCLTSGSSGTSSDNDYDKCHFDSSNEALRCAATGGATWEHFTYIMNQATYLMHEKGYEPPIDIDYQTQKNMWPYSTQNVSDYLEIQGIPEYLYIVQKTDLQTIINFYANQVIGDSNYYNIYSMGQEIGDWKRLTIDGQDYITFETDDETIPLTYPINGLNGQNKIDLNCIKSIIDKTKQPILKASQQPNTENNTRNYKDPAYKDPTGIYASAMKGKLTRRRTIN